MRAAWAAVVTLASLGGGCRACADAPAPTASSAAFFPAPSFTRSDVPTDDAEAILAKASTYAARLERGFDADGVAFDAAVDDAILVARVRGAREDFEALARVGADWKLPLSPARARVATKASIALGQYAAARRSSAQIFAAGHDAYDLECDIALGLGDLDVALDRASALRAEKPGPGSSLRVGRVRAARGDVGGADAALVEAERAFDGGSPFLLAEIYFARGELWERAGDLVKATALYRAAVSHAPMHGPAATHLASLVPLLDAVALLEPLVARGAGPEVRGALGVYRELLQTGRGAADTARATADYAALVGPSPPPAPILANHAGWFFVRVTNDRANALQAARVDVVEHPSSEAFTLALTVLDAPEDRDERCRVAAAARAFDWPAPALVEALRQVGDCPR